jgi:phosphoribosyl 1,2-cyclic phosphodiesterase
MKVSVLASGSNGNATLVETNEYSFLIDDGISFKMLLQRLNECGSDLNNIKGIFLTHEHVDHVAGLKVLLKKVDLMTYVTKGTYAGLNAETKEVIKEESVTFIKAEDEIIFGKTKITIIKSHHDAREPIGLIIEEDNKKLVYITDTGYVDQLYYPKLTDANIYIMESNYDVELLWSSGRPFELKKRIDGDHGHMSNDMSAVLLAKLIGPKTKEVILAHISDDCNYYFTPNIIINMHKKVYSEIGIDFSNINFTCGNRKGITGVYEI